MKKPISTCAYSKIKLQKSYPNNSMLILESNLHMR